MTKRKTAEKTQVAKRPTAPHTPGTWKAEAADPLGLEFEINSGEGRNGLWSAVATVPANNLGSRAVMPSEAAANARLIAAAPELVRIVRVLHEWFGAGPAPIHADAMPFTDGDDDTLVAAVRAAISKVQGRS